MHSLAKRVYSNAKEIVPPDNTSLKRDLISSCSYMNELLGNYEGALSDAKKLEKFCHKWSEVRAIFCIHIGDSSQQHLVNLRRMEYECVSDVELYKKDI